MATAFAVALLSKEAQEELCSECRGRSRGSGSVHASALKRSPGPAAAEGEDLSEAGARWLGPLLPQRHLVTPARNHAFNTPEGYDASWSSRRVVVGKEGQVDGSGEEAAPTGVSSVISLFPQENLSDI